MEYDEIQNKKKAEFLKDFNEEKDCNETIKTE